MPVTIGARIEQRLTLDAEAISAGARLVNDVNPLHHDPAFAKNSRFGELIASGAHVAGLLAGLSTRGFGAPDEPRGKGGVGVDYSVEFRAPVRVDRKLLLEWVVAAIEPKRSGTIMRLEGRIVDLVDGVTVLSARMTTLAFH